MIPTEIVDHILSFLHSAHDYISLEKCSLVFPEIAHRRLYSSITTVEGSFSQTALMEFTQLASDDYVVDLRKLSHTLLHQPQIRSFIRAIRIFLGNPGLVDSEESCYSFQDHIIDFLISRLPQLESISLAALSEAHKFEWSSFSPMFRASFQNAIMSPTIKQVKVLHINNFSLETFEDCSNLKDLFIQGRVADGDCVSTSLYPKLSSLHITGYSARVDSWLRSNTLHTLSLHFTDLATLLSFRMLIETCSTTLVNLMLRDTGYTRIHDPQSNNHDQFHQHPIQFHCLNQIQLHITIYVDRYVYLSCVPHLTPFLVFALVSFPAPSIQLCIELDIQVRLGHDRMPVNWSALVPLLRLSHFRHPIEISITAVNRPTKSFRIQKECRENPDMEKFIEEGKLHIRA